MPNFDIDNPLVSIIVVTYNSENYVLETLESIKAQTYSNIELIVSDDFSNDSTVEISTKWLDENKRRFIRSEILTTDVNRGMPANCNRGINASKGEWIKIIAGDDALTNQAVELVMSYVNRHLHIEVLSTQVEKYNGSFEIGNATGILPKDWRNMPVYSQNVNVKMQLEFVLSGGYHIAPGLFIKNDVFNRVGLYDEGYRYIEDIPFYLKLGFNNILIYFGSIITVKYRKHDNSVTMNKSIILPKYFPEYCEALFRASVKYRNIFFRLNSLWNLLIVELIFKLGNKGTFCSKLNTIRIELTPIRFFRFLKWI